MAKTRRRQPGGMKDTSVSEVERAPLRYWSSPPDCKDSFRQTVCAAPSPTREPYVIVLGFGSALGSQLAEWRCAPFVWKPPCLSLVYAWPCLDPSVVSIVVEQMLPRADRMTSFRVLANSSHRNL